MPSLRLTKHVAIQMRRSKLLHHLIDGTSKGQPVVICLDTGACGSVVGEESREKFVLAGAGGEQQIGGLGSAAMKAQEATCRELDLGGFPVAEMGVIVTSLEHVNATLKHHDEEPYDMILGADFLLGHRAVIDCARARLFLHPDYVETEELRRLRVFRAMLDRPSGI